MLSAFANCFSIPELRRRLIFTLGIIVIVRIGAAIPIPGINASLLNMYFDQIVNQQATNNVVGLINIFSGGALQNCAIFSLGIMPYISASIMMQLMTVVIPSLGKMAREEGGRQKINQYTRYLTLALCVVQGYFLAITLQNPETNPFLSGIGEIIASQGKELVPNPGIGFIFTVIITNMAGTMLLVWLGEQITDKGVGNGISLVITVGILASLPAALASAYSMFFGVQADRANPLLVVVLIGFLILVVAGVVAVTQAQRKIRVDYAKRVVGRKMYGGQTSYLPLKVNYAGVMPIIFAQTLLMFPNMLMGFIPNEVLTDWPWIATFAASLERGSLHYILLAAMILFFSYFWVATQFNPIQIADDLKKNGGYIPGIRPGQPTAAFLDYTMSRLTLAGAIFLTILAVLPQLINLNLGIPFVTASFFGGTSLLITVGVLLDTMRQIETYLLQKNYEGFLKKGRLKGRTAGSVPLSSNVASSESLAWLWTIIAILVVLGAAAAAFQRIN
jgi:preprotein translocase subunit SecY